VTPSNLPEPALWPLALWIAVVALLLGGVVALSALVGPRSSSRRRDLPYESGIPSTPQSDLRFPVHFYPIALAFLVFDLEAAFLFAWATAARDVGWLGYFEVLVFSVMLFAGLVYLWAKRAFDWGVERE
jgi:NADH-quinone oxidoreductase subunit A